MLACGITIFKIKNMKISFPEYLFESPPKENILSGKKICKDSKILFCGIARNVEKTLKNNLNRINYIRKYFKESDIFIYENDSIDNTVDILKNESISYISENRNDSNYREKIESGEDSNHFNRCKILSSCRNKYIAYAREYCKQYDYICVLDWDIRGWSYKGFYDSIFRLYFNNSLASVSAYGVLSDYNNLTLLEDNPYNLLMYDSFAFRPRGFVGPLYQEIQSRFNYYKFKTPVLVRSNFGGMAIYKYNILSSFEYSTNQIEGCVNSEHVIINDNISLKGFTHLLNNYLIVSYSKHRFDND